MEYKEQLSTKLIDEDYREYQNMNAMREEVFARLRARDEKKAKKIHDASSTTPGKAEEKVATTSGSFNLLNMLAFFGSRIAAE